MNSAQNRPLDYDYLKSLTPMAQRFYELLSYQIYGAIKNKTEAKMIYSEFCTYAPQTRFFDWDQVRPQMYRLHKIHTQSGYIDSISCEEFRHDDGTLDWKFIYVPGQKAKGEYNLVTNKRLRKFTTNSAQPLLIPDEPMPPLIPDVELSFTKDEERLISKMSEFRVSEKKARKLVKNHRKAVEREILFFPARLVGTNIKNPSGLFIRAVEENYEPPQVFFEIEEQKEIEKRSEAKRKKQQAAEKAEKEKNDAWFRAKKCFLDLPEKERDELWEEKRQQILESNEYKNADESTLKILELAIDGMIQAVIIEELIKEEENG